ncbi:hypothetical protein SLEP1_g60312, partial [Rubroshorea leprosula]
MSGLRVAKLVGVRRKVALRLASRGVTGTLVVGCAVPHGGTPGTGDGSLGHHTSELGAPGMPLVPLSQAMLYNIVDSGTSGTAFAVFSRIAKSVWLSLYSKSTLVGGSVFRGASGAWGTRGTSMGCLSVSVGAIWWNGTDVGAGMGYPKKARLPLREVRQGSAESKSSFVVDADELPIVNPSTIRTVGVDVARLTTSYAVSAADSAFLRNRWISMLQHLQSDREDTVLDIRRSVEEYHDQAMLKRIKIGVLDVYTTHLHACINREAEWPWVFGVESWLRQGVALSTGDEVGMAMVKLWCLVTAATVGPEAVRGTCAALQTWYSYDIAKGACSKRGNEMQSAVSWGRSVMQRQHYWIMVQTALEQASDDSYGDHRRQEMECRVHGNGQCPVGARKAVVRRSAALSVLERTNGWQMVDAIDEDERAVLEAMWEEEDEFDYVDYEDCTGDSCLGDCTNPQGC